MNTRQVRELGVLGPTMVRVDGSQVALRPRERDLLAALALVHPQPASVTELSAVLWPVSIPATAKTTIQNHVARVRRALGSDVILTVDGRYRLAANWTLDVDEFEALVGRGRRRAIAGDHPAARVDFEQARSLVRGDAYADLDDGPTVEAARRRHRELAASAEEELLFSLIADGEHHAAIAEASRQVTRAPAREVRWASWALALYRSGQRRSSIRVFADCRRMLRDEAGMDPGPELTRLEALVLADDQRLMTASPATLAGHRPGTAAPSASDVFVGRTAELEQVRRGLRSTFDGRQAASITVIGPEGIGKTAFLERVATQAALDGWHVISVRCPSTPTRPLEPLVEIARQVIEFEANPADAFSPEVLADLSALSTGRLDAARGDLGEAIIDVVVGHAERSPTLLVVDDAHQLPATAAGLLRRIAAASAPVFGVFARPPDGVATEPGDGTTIVLDGLDHEESTRLLEALSGGDTWASLVTVFHRATDGVPARLVDEVRRSRSVGSKEASPDEVDVSRPLILDALDHLGPDAQAVAAILALAGGPIPLDVLADTFATLGRPSLEYLVRQGVDVGVFTIDAEDRVATTDPRLDRALVAELSVDERSDRREQLGVALLEAGEALTAAPHLLAVAARNPRRAIEVAERAAHRAVGATMFHEAADLLDQAAEVARTSLGAAHPRRLRLLIDRAELLRLLGDPRGTDLAWDVVRQADAAGDATLVARAAATLCRLGPLTEAGTLNVELADLVERAIAECDDPLVRAQCAGEATLFYSMTGRVDRCSAHFHDALSNARRSGDDGAVLGVLGNVYVALTHPDELDLRDELAEEMLMLADRHDDDDARFQALHLYFSNQVQRADPLLRSTFTRQEQLAGSLRSPARRWMVGYQRACLAHLDGRLDDAMRISEENLATAPVARSRAMSNHWMWTVVTSLARGTGEEMASEIDAVIEAQPGLPGWRAVAAWLAALRGDHERVRAECDALERGAALPRDMTWGAALMLLGRSVAQCGSDDDRVAVAQRLRPFSGLMTWWGSGTIGPFDLALAELSVSLGDPAAARAHLAVAQRNVDRLHAVVYQADLDAVAV